MTEKQNQKKSSTELKNSLPVIMTVPETAEYLKLSKSKVYYLVQQNQIPHLKIGKNVRIRKEDLLVWLEEKVQPSNDLWSGG